MACMDKETASAYLSGYLDAAESQQWAGHIASCECCQGLVEEVSGLLDDVRKALMAGDCPFHEGEIPAPEQVRRRPRCSPTVAPVTNDTLTKRLQQSTMWPLAEHWRRWSVRGALALAMLVVGFAVFHAIASRSVLHAEEILRRARMAAGISRSIPGHVIHRVYKLSLTNGMGPPDGEYRTEVWWDNVDHRSVSLRRDVQGHLREGNWLLADGSIYIYSADDESSPLLTIFPSDAAIREEIERLPAATRDRVKALLEHSRRPFYEAAVDSKAETEREINDSASGPEAENRVHEVKLASGQKLYRVTSHVYDGARIIPHWDVTQLIADKTYLVIEDHRTGYRRDGLIYDRDLILLQEQVLLPGEVNAQVFSPGPFPSAAKVKKISPKERVEALEQTLQPAQ